MKQCHDPFSARTITGKGILRVCEKGTSQPYPSPKWWKIIPFKSTLPSSLEPLAWSITHQLTALYETEKDESYLEKAKKIREMLLEIK